MHKISLSLNARYSVLTNKNYFRIRIPDSGSTTGATFSQIYEMVGRVLGEQNGRRRLSTGWGRSWAGRRTCREPEGWSRGPATPSRTPATMMGNYMWPVVFHVSNRIITVIIGIRTWMFSMSSELSQRMDESFTLLISANWREWNQPLLSHNNNR